MSRVRVRKDDVIKNLLSVPSSEDNLVTVEPRKLLLVYVLSISRQIVVDSKFIEDVIS